MRQPVTYENLNKAEIDAIRGILEKYNLEHSATDSEIEAWAEWALENSLVSRLETVAKHYKLHNDKVYYLMCMEVLKLFYPEVDSPLFNIMREMNMEDV